MRVVIISEYNSYVSIGGTENYIDSLIAGIASKDLEVVFFSLNNKPELLLKNIDIKTGFSFELLLLPNDSNDSSACVEPNYIYIRNFLSEFKPDVVNIHTLTPFFNLDSLFDLQKYIQCRYYITLHVPAPVCLKGDMIKFNRFPCDGRLGNICYACLFSLGAKKGLSSLYKMELHYLKKRLKDLSKLEVRIICVSNWQYNQLIDSGYPNDLLFVSRQVSSLQPHVTSLKLPIIDQDFSSKFIVGILTRPTNVKGILLLKKVVQFFSSNDLIEFQLAFPADYNFVTLEKLNLDSINNVSVRYDIDDTNKQDFLAGLDLLLITSFGFETGPITALEAVACRLSCLVPDVGGTFEYSQTYPELIKTYNWNDLGSLIDQLQLMRSSQTKRAFKDTIMRNNDDLGGEYVKIFKC